MLKKSELLKKMSECGEKIEAIDEALKIVDNTGFKPSVLNMHVKSSDSSNSNNHQELNVRLDYEETKKVLELLRDLEISNWIRLEENYKNWGMDGVF